MGARVMGGRPPMFQTLSEDFPFRCDPLDANTLPEELASEQRRQTGLPFYVVEDAYLRFCEQCLEA
jgi:hypothetical protein